MSNTADIKEALELAMARIGCPPGDNADADIYHRLSRALAILADMEREGEPVKLTDADHVCDLLMQLHREFYGQDKAHADAFRVLPKVIKFIKAHQSPTAADAKDSAVDVQEVIRVGDAMANRLKIMETGAGLQAVWSEITKTFRP